MNSKYKFEAYENPKFPVYSSVQTGSGVLVKPHFHKAAEIIRVDKRCVEVIIDTLQLTCDEGDILFIPPYSIHSATSRDNDSCIEGLVFELSMLTDVITDIDVAAILNKEYITNFVLDRNDSEVSLLNEGFSRIRSLYPKDSITNQLDIASALYSITSSLIKLYCGGEQMTRSADYVRILPVIDYINENYYRKIYIRDLSKLLHVCDDHMIRLFKAVMNKSPMKYILDKRTEEAMKLLINTDIPICGISDKVGFSTPTYMSNVFKSNIGMTPHEYRCKLCKR